MANGAKIIILSKVRMLWVVSMPFGALSLMSHVSNTRNQVKLQAYQRDYAQQKQAHGHRKVGKAERKLLEERHAHKRQLMAMENLPPCSNTAISQCIPSIVVIRY